MGIRQTWNMHHNDNIGVFADVRNIKLKNVLWIVDKEGPLVLKGCGFNRGKKNVKLVKVKKFDGKFLVF